MGDGTPLQTAAAWRRVVSMERGNQFPVNPKRKGHGRADAQLRQPLAFLN